MTLPKFLAIFYLLISEKSINFALVIEISRHIEILLLSNDCVIVPGLGGFMAHHVQAHFEEEENSFLPPLRTLGFNPQLKMNDSLLVQSYIEAYDISYPEALKRIEDEVSELTQHIHNEGEYELTGIGTLSMNSDGNYVFTPCEAGILTPSLYALSSFEFPRLVKKTPAELLAVSTPQQPQIPEETAVITEKPAEDEDATVTGSPETEEASEPESEADTDSDDSDTLVIKMSWIRNAVAVAAAVLMFVLMTTPVSNSQSNMAYSSLGSTAIFDTTKKIVSPKVVVPDNKPDTVIAEPDTVAAKTDTTASKTATDIATPKAAEEQKAKSAVTKEVTGFCLVLASYVSMKNAEAFVERLHKEGFKEAEIYVRNKVTRVVYGNFHTINDAYNRLNELHSNKDFEEAWVLKTTDRG